MKPREDRFRELYEQVLMLVEVSETEARLSKLFPQSRFNVGTGVAKELEKEKKKNVGKKGKFHSVVKMKKSSVLLKKDEPEEAEAAEVVPGTEQTLNNDAMSPEETIRAMQDPNRVVQDMIAQGMQPEEIVQALVSQGMTEEEATSLVQQVMNINSPTQ